MNPSDYASSIGVVKSLETGLIPAHKLRRMAEFADYEDFKRALGETPYASLKFPDDDTESALYDGLYALLEKYLADAPLREVFLAEHGFAAALAAIKVSSADGGDGPARGGGAARSGSRARYRDISGNKRVAEVVSAVEHRKFFGLKPPLEQVCRLLTAGKGAPSAAEADFRAYDAFFSWAINMTSDFPAAESYFRIRADAANAANYVGNFALGGGIADRDFFNGGYISPLIFKAAANSGAEPSALFGSPRFHDYKKTFAPDSSGVYIASAASKFSDDAASEHWIKMRLEPFGFHHLCGYVHAKKVEIKNLKIIASGIRSRAGREAIKSRLRRTYF